MNIQLATIISSKLEEKCCAIYRSSDGRLKIGRVQIQLFSTGFFLEGRVLVRDAHCPVVCWPHSSSFPWPFTFAWFRTSIRIGTDWYCQLALDGTTVTTVRRVHEL